MDIYRAPLRISFFGGGTDNPEWVAAHGRGAVLGTAIDLYAEYCRESKRVTLPVEQGTGLGQSSAEMVARMGGTHWYPDGVTLATDAWQEERNAGSGTGWQDALFAACGGFQFIEFDSNGPTLHPVPSNRLEELQEHLVLLDTGIRRDRDYSRNASRKAASHASQLRLQVRMAEEGVNFLTGATSMAAFGSMVHSAWQLKRSLGTSLPQIDRLYDEAIDAGAFGGKLLGAGGGGYLLLIVPPEKREKVVCGRTVIRPKINAKGFHRVTER